MAAVSSKRLLKAFARMVIAGILGLQLSVHAFHAPRMLRGTAGLLKWKASSVEGRGTTQVSTISSKGSRFLSLSSWKLSSLSLQRTWAAPWPQGRLARGQVIRGSLGSLRMDTESDKSEERKTDALTSSNSKLKISVIKSMKEVGEEEWNLCSLASAGDGKENPFLDWAFLNALEESGSACQESGWVPWHILARDKKGTLLGCVPLYLKGHSYGEYVFDHAWARAYRAFSRQPYYPKLQSCVPFTPVTGPRLMARGDTEEEAQAVTKALAKAISAVCDQTGASSAHVTFPKKTDWATMGSEGFLQRTGIQYHWLNDDFATFDDFLGSLKQSRRKSIRQERKKVVKAGLKVRRLRGAEIRAEHWDAFYRFYTSTVDEKWGQAYLTRSFFKLLGEHMADKVLLIVAEEAATGKLVAGALNLIGGDCLYGRNWGCIKKYDSLHFELCYYQAIEAAIELGLARVEAGAQGEHKISRGYLPTFTYSAHYIRDGNFRTAVEEALHQEREQVVYTTAMLTIQQSPYKASPEAHLAAHGIEIRRR